MKQLHFFLSTLLLVVFVACGDDSNEYKIGGKTGEDTPVQPDERQSAGPEIAKYNLEFPALKGGNSIVVVHSGILNDTYNKSGVNYSVEWDTSLRAQRWSCYQMYSSVNYHSSYNVSRYRADNDGSLSAECQYPNDPDLPEAYRMTADPYKYNGYDHGHICPSADRQYSKEANRQTFFLTNMQPQRNVFNAGVWQQMEQQVRNWNRGSFRDTLYVCKGGTIDRADQISRTLSNGLIVPKFFFMAFLCKNKSGYKAMAFWIEHKDKDTDYPKDNQGNYQLSPYVTNIRELETLTGIDFFCNLDDETEERVETLGVENIKSAWGLK